MNMKLAVVRVLQNFSFKPCKETEVGQSSFFTNNVLLGGAFFFMSRGLCACVCVCACVCIKDCILSKGKFILLAEESIWSHL